MGAQALEANDFRAAEQLFHQIVEQDPRVHPAWNALSVVAIRAGLPDIAVEHAKRALELDRRNPLYLNNLGVALGELGRFAEAEETFRRALKQKPAYAEGQFNLGKTLQKLGRLDDALRAFERAYAMDRRFPGLAVALCQMYRKLAQPARAMAILRELPGGVEQSDAIAPLVVETLEETDGTPAALGWLRQVAARHPDWQQTRFTLGQMLLSLGEWREGWREYSRRSHAVARRASGEPLPPRLDGADVLLEWEQGIGDTLFFLRFAQALSERGARICLAAQPKIAALLAGDARFAALSSGDAPAGEFQHRLLLGDLPTRLQADAPAPAFVLRADPERVVRMRERFAVLGPPPYLGVTWRAGTEGLHTQEFGRDRALLSKRIPLQALGAALRGWRGTLLTLQREPQPGELDAMRGATGASMYDLSALNEDLPEILAALALLDEYVAVSNTNMHLLAGLGRTARVLVPYPAEWRWMREGGSSPWFPGFSIYREPRSRGWEQPLAALRRDLIG